jgi:hypothetical protein
MYFMLLDSESDDDEQVEIVRRPRIFRKRINFRFQSFFEFNERFRLSSVKMEANIIKCCAALCNYARDGDNLEIQHENFPNFRRNDEPLPNDNVNVAGRQRLQEIIQHFR